MVIICVGPDCAGKTSMIKELVAQNVAQLEQHKVSPPFTEETYDYVIATLEEQLGNTEKDVVWDRIPVIDDLVYSHTMDERASYYEASGQLKKISALLRRCMIVYIYAESETLIERAKARAGENDKYLGQELSAGDLEEIQMEYAGVFSTLDIEACVYGVDTTHMSKLMAEETLAMLYYRNRTQVKSQKIAHIVPRDSLYMTSSNQYHMCLAQLCVDETYKAFFRRRAAEGKFVLLDNGAAEETTMDVDYLFKLAQEIGAKEIVLPDKLKHMEETMRRTKEAYDKYVALRDAVISRGGSGDECGFGIMLVPQGANFDQWKRCAEQMVEMFPLATSYGVPKALVTSEDPYARFYAVEYLCELLMAKDRDAEIHLLGMNEPPAIVQTIFESFPRVRGIDSAFAYLCTQALVPISNPYIERPAGTIDFLEGKDLKQKLDINMQLLSLNINHNQNGVDYTWSR